MRQWQVDQPEITKAKVNIVLGTGEYPFIGAAVLKLPVHEVYSVS